MQRTAFVKTLAGPKRSNENENQDSCISIQINEMQLVVVADGHGSSPHNRSDMGSKFACESVVEIVREYFESLPEKIIDPENLKDFWEKQAFQMIKAKWNEKVENHIAESIREGVPELSNKNQCSYQLGKYGWGTKYGTTLICCMVYDDGVAIGQVGDGMAVVVGQNVHFPLVEDKNELNDTTNLTDSLCSPRNSEKFRCFNNKSLPKLVAVFTDGVDNAFISSDEIEEYFLELKNELPQKSLHEIERDVESLCKDCSENSNDDTTIGIIINDLNLDITDGSKDIGHNR